MQAEFRPPRRRTRVREEYEAPLPISRSPGEKIDLRADLINQHVLVCDPDHIEKIYNQGYFGKGVLSRARPDHSLSDQWEQHEGFFLPVVSQSRYEELLRWAGTALSAQGLDEETVSQMLLQLSQPVEMEDVRREVAGGREGEEGEGRQPERGVRPPTKRLRSGSEVSPEPKRSCSLDKQELEPDTNSDPSSDKDLDSSPDPEPVSEPGSDCDPDPKRLVPGPGFVLVVSDLCEVGGGFREVRRTPFSLSEYLQLNLEEVTRQHSVSKGHQDST
uniref:Uncharacterized protein n=1 Tax=Anabas testudineus TaxID=64144 RepID=A0AAQ6IUX4_ANATE